MTTNTVDVVIPTFNSEGTIEKSIGSVLGQVGVRVRMIVVDNCSADGTLDIVSALVRSWDRVIVEKDSGVYNAMNKALGHVSSEFVCFLNSDDYFLNDISLSNLVTRAQKDSVDVVVSDVVMTYSLFDRKISSRYGVNQRWMRLGLSPPHQGQVWRSRFLKETQLRFDESFYHAADFLFFWEARTYHSAKITSVPNMSTVGMSSGGLSTRPGSHRINNFELTRAVVALTHSPFAICWLAVRARLAFKLWDFLIGIFSALSIRLIDREK